MSDNENLTAKIEQIAKWIDVTESYVDEHGNTKWRNRVDPYEVVSEVYGAMGTLTGYVVVDELNAIALAVDPAETMISLTERWTAQERRTPAASWRRWSTDRLAKFVVDGFAKVMPPFWWQVDYDDALTVAARVIDNWRGVGLDIDGAPRVLFWDTREFVEAIRSKIIGFARNDWL